MIEVPKHEYDVLVVGAGGAGLRAAIEASAAGVKVGVVSKSLLGKAHTVMAEGGVAAALANVDDRDSWRVHFADTLRGGQYINQPRMAEIHAREAPDRVRELEAWGALFDRTPDGRILQRNFGGHRYPRLAHVGDRTGLEMIRTLQDHGIHRGINFHMEHTVIALLTDDGRVTGAFGYDREKGRGMLFAARAVVLATGGIGRAYSITSNSWEYTGDGHALAYHAGAELMDMEFVQFHPTGMVWPPSVRGILVTEGVRGEGGVLRNSEGRRFMFDDIPPNYKDQTADNEEEGWRYCQGDKNARRPPELLTRDHVARCIVREIREGRGSEHGGVFLDISWIKEKIPNAAEHIKKKLPSMYHQFKELAGIDITKEPMEVGPTTHYMMGGVRVDSETQMATTVPGLFAAGECGAGLHGANRLGGNSLSDLLVFGKRAGEHAAAFAKAHGAGRIDEAQVDAAARRAMAPFEHSQGAATEGPYQVQHDLQKMMQDLVGIVRHGPDMEQALVGIAELWRRSEKVAVPGNREYNPGWHTALDLPNLLTVSEAVTRAALERKESRGAQFRDDFPDKNSELGKVNLVVRKGKDGEMQVLRVPVPEMTPEQKAIVEEMK
jgi:succinate dehydrogenase / fumarate reductase, flavoprotein subunit